MQIHTQIQGCLLSFHVSIICRYILRYKAAVTMDIHTKYYLATRYYIAIDMIAHRISDNHGYSCRQYQTATDAFAHTISYRYGWIRSHDIMWQWILSHTISYNYHIAMDVCVQRISYTRAHNIILPQHPCWNVMRWFWLSSCMCPRMCQMNISVLIPVTYYYLPKFTILASMFVCRFVCLLVCPFCQA